MARTRKSVETRAFLLEKSGRKKIPTQSVTSPNERMMEKIASIVGRISALVATERESKEGNKKITISPKLVRELLLVTKEVVRSDASVMSDGLCSVLRMAFNDPRAQDDLAFVATHSEAMERDIFEALYEKKYVDDAARLLNRIHRIGKYVPDLISQLDRRGEQRDAENVLIVLGRLDPASVGMAAVAAIASEGARRSAVNVLSSLGVLVLEPLSAGLENDAVRRQCFDLLVGCGEAAAPAIAASCSYPELAVEARAWIREHQLKAVPELALALCREKPEPEVVDALIEFEDLGAQAAVQALRGAKASGNFPEYYRRRGEIGVSDFVSVIHAGMDERMRQIVADILVCVGSDGIVPAFRAAVGRCLATPVDRPSVAGIFGDALNRLDLSVSEQLVPLLAEEELQSCLVPALCARGEALVPPLATALGNEALEAPATMLLAGCGGSGAAAVLEAFRDEARKTRILGALARSGEEGMKALVALHADSGLRADVAPYLTQCTSTPLKVLIGRVREAQGEYCEGLCAAVAAFGVTAVSDVIALRNTKGEAAGKRILTLIGPESIPLLAPLLTSREERLREYAVDAVKGMGGAAVPALIAMYAGEKTGRGRETVISLLGSIAAEDAYMTIRMAVSADTDPDVRAAAVGALRKYFDTHRDDVLETFRWGLSDTEAVVQNAVLRRVRDLRHQAAPLKDDIAFMAKHTKNQQLRSAADKAIAEIHKKG